MDAATWRVRRSEGDLWTDICSVPASAGISGSPGHLFVVVCTQTYMQGFSAFHTFAYALCAR